MEGRGVRAGGRCATPYAAVIAPTCACDGGERLHTYRYYMCFILPFISVYYTSLGSRRLPAACLNISFYLCLLLWRRGNLEEASYAEACLRRLACLERRREVARSACTYNGGGGGGAQTVSDMACHLLQTWCLLVSLRCCVAGTRSGGLEEGWSLGAAPTAPATPCRPSRRSTLCHCLGAAAAALNAARLLMPLCRDVRMRDTRR